MYINVVCCPQRLKFSPGCLFWDLFPSLNTGNYLRRGINLTTNQRLSLTFRRDRNMIDDGDSQTSLSPIFSDQWIHTQYLLKLISTSSVFLNLMYVFKAILSIQRFFSLTKLAQSLNWAIPEQIPSPYCGHLPYLNPPCLRNFQKLLSPPPQPCPWNFPFFSSHPLEIQANMALTSVFQYSWLQIQSAKFTFIM